jgi:hypothetical protein
MYEIFFKPLISLLLCRGINLEGRVRVEEKEHEKDKIPNRSRSPGTRVMPKRSFLRGDTQ